MGAQSSAVKNPARLAVMGMQRGRLKRPSVMWKYHGFGSAKFP
jgi:hypothetical protein